MAKKYNIKVEHNGYWLKYTNCHFIDSLEDYKIYMQELNNKFTVSESEIKNNKTWVGHGHSQLTGISGMFCGMIEDIENRGPMLEHLTLLHGEVVAGQLQYLLDGCKLVINRNGGYFSIKDEKYEIIAIENDNYIETDIKINKWWGGSHFYAKIGNIDVVGDNGDIKWNTEKRAKEIAIQYMNKLNTSSL